MKTSTANQWKTLRERRKTTLKKIEDKKLAKSVQTQIQTQIPELIGAL